MAKLLSVVFALIIVHNVQIAFCETAFVHDIRGAPAFEAEMTKHSLIFAKFFHPGCPHCQAMKKAYDDLAEKFHWKNSSLRFIEIDGSSKINSAVIEKHASGFPTLKLFIRGKLIAEYGGSREKNLMADFLIQHLALESAPLVSHLRSDGELKKFLNAHANRTFVIANGGLRDPSLDAEFRATALVLRTAGVPPIAFAILDDFRAFVRGKYLDNLDRVQAQDGMTAYAVAARGLANFETVLQRWSPGVMGGDSLESFMHVATLPLDGTAQLTRANALAVSGSPRPILYAIGSRTTPNLATRDELRDIARFGGEDLVVVYVHDLDFLELRQHLGLAEIMDEDKKMPRKTEYVLYRAGNRGAERQVFSEEKFPNKKAWIGTFFDTHIRASKRPFAAFTVNRLTLANWDALLNHDGRAVLLSMCQPRFGTCDRFERTLDRVASLLGPSSSKIIVASYDTSQGQIPKSATFKMPENLPYVAVMLPGEKPKEIEAMFDPFGIEKLAMKVVQSKSEPANADSSTVEDPRFIVTSSHIGVLFIVVGIAMSVQRSCFYSRYATLERIRRASAKSV